MADVERVRPPESEVSGDKRPRNLQALVSVWSAGAALVLLLMYQQIRGATLLFAVPTAGLISTIYGIVGLIRVRSVGSGRGEAWVGLIVGVVILVGTGIVGLYIWEISRSNWQF